jgi:putative transposase
MLCPSHVPRYNEAPCRKDCVGFTAAANAISSPAPARQPFLGSARRRDVFLQIFEQVRRQFDFVVWGYVVMPEHFHLLVSEPRNKSLSRAMQVLKQRVSRRCRKWTKNAAQITLWDKPPVPAFWQPRYYDFNVFRERKHIEKLRYMHRNPVKRGLVASPELWPWSSFRFYRFGEEGAVKIGDGPAV